MKTRTERLDVQVAEALGAAAEGGCEQEAVRSAVAVFECRPHSLATSPSWYRKGNGRQKPGSYSIETRTERRDVQVAQALGAAAECSYEQEATAVDEGEEMEREDRG
jgi:hypothetical protein